MDVCPANRTFDPSTPPSVRFAGFYGNLPKTQIDLNRSMSAKAPVCNN
jgi:hypothetical protein